MLRKILCDYEFNYDCRTYKGYGLYLGETNLPKLPSKDFICDLVCTVLKMTPEELGLKAHCKYWDINRLRLENIGFRFTQMEIYLYPKP